MYRSIAFYIMVKVRKNLRNVIVGAICLAGVTVFAGCDKDPKDNPDNNGTGTETGTTTTDDPNLERAIHSLGYMAQVKEQYDKGAKPNYITGSSGSTVATVTYLPNGALGHVYTNKYGDYVLFSLSQPMVMTNTTREVATEGQAFSIIRSGEYDYAKDPAKVIAGFGSWTGSSVFTSLSNLKLIANNDAITEEVYNSIRFSTNCYKMLVFGKHSSGKLIGKYVGYSTNGKTFIYWCIDPESASFGKQASKSTPYS
jgi:hypothetical protein